jgi:hypothetical protein
LYGELVGVAPRTEGKFLVANVARVDNDAFPRAFSLDEHNERMAEWDARMGAQHRLAVCGVCGTFARFNEKEDLVVPLGELPTQLLLPSGTLVPADMLEWRNLVEVYEPRPCDEAPLGPVRYFGLAPPGVLPSDVCCGWSIKRRLKRPASPVTWCNSDNQPLSCLVCSICKGKLDSYERKAKDDPSIMLPRCTLMRADWGRVPSHMPTCTLAEVFYMSDVLNFSLLIKLHGIGQGNTQLALKGHFIAFPHDAALRTQTYCRNLPRGDMPEFFKITLLGKKSIMSLFRKTLKDRLGCLHGRANVVIMWMKMMVKLREHMGRPWNCVDPDTLDPVVVQASFDAQLEQVVAFANVEEVTSEMAMAIEAQASADVARSTHDPHADPEPGRM